MTGRVVLMGSGELAPRMVATHRDSIEAARADRVLVLDTPFGFQENADELTAKIVDFFGTSLSRPVDVATLRGRDDPPATVERALAAVRSARCIFTGPGSPTYALEIWRATGMAEALTSALAAGASLVFASAAALTLGSKTIPVYEIYKAGAEPYWERGLDVLGAMGFPVTVVPHWNNAEGGTHDTSRCFIGEHRLGRLEADADHGIIGIDEHTAVTLDFERAIISVSGLSTATLRGSETVTLEAGRSLPMEEARAILVGDGTPLDAGSGPGPAAHVGFSAAIEARDVDAALEAALSVEMGVFEGRYDRSELRGVIAVLSQVAAVGLNDPGELVGPFVETLLELRERARAVGRFDDADLIRDRLASGGVEVRDTAEGVEWSYRA